MPEQDKKPEPTTEPADGELLTGIAFQEFLLAYLASVTDWDALHHTVVAGPHLRVHVLRCRPFRDFLEVLKDHATVATLAHQHDAVKALIF
ncbi:hypothetical protein GF373_17265 [bacterium]|nr:hypothetical protein [bacterium]